MSAEIVGVDDGIVTVELSGLLAPADWASVQQVVEKTIRDRGKASVLVLAAGFGGWAPGKDWDDQSFFEKNDPCMEKMAILGEKKWEDPILIFSGQGFRRCLIEYFLTGEGDKARAWLAEPRAE